MKLIVKNATIALDPSDTRILYGRKLFRVVAVAAIAAMGITQGDKGGWCSEEAIVGDRVQWIADNATFWGGTFRGGTFRGGTFRGGTFWGGTFWGGTFWGGTFWGGTFWGGTFWGGTFWGGTFRGGTFWGGTFRGGTFWGGTFWGGTFRGGPTTGMQPLNLNGLRWQVAITDSHMTIGCQTHPLSKWWRFRDPTISKMDRDALEFWRQHKATLQALCAATGREAGLTEPVGDVEESGE